MRAFGLILMCVGAFASSAEFPNEERKARIEAEIENAGPGHPWAGGYYEGDGLGTNASLLLSPAGEYSFENWGCLGLYGRDAGKIRQRDGVIQFEGAASYELAGRNFHVVPWGERVYLLEDADLVHFANDFNLGWEPRYGSHGLRFMRQSKKLLLASGLPRVPKDIEPYLLKHAVDAVVVAVGTSTVISSGTVDAGRLTTDVTLDAGGRAGLLPGMELVLRGDISGEATIRQVDASSSKAVLVSSVAPQIGWRVSTRYDWNRDLAPIDQPYRIRVAGAHRGRWPPYADDLGYLSSDDPIKGAEENGFKVSEVARVEIAAVDPHLFSYDLITPKIAEILAPLGANVYSEPMGTRARGLKGPYGDVQTVVGYRVEFHGRPIDGLALVLGEGWPGTRAYLLLEENKYHSEERRLRVEFYREHLHLTREQSEAWGTLKVENLTAEQVSAFREHLGLTVAKGLVHEALPPTPSKWTETLEAEIWGRLKPLRDSEPKTYSEFRALTEKVYHSKR